MHNMAEKIEMFAGWDWDSSVIVGREMNQHLPNRCTVVVHDNKSERVFTESEVRAMIESACRSMDFPYNKILADHAQRSLGIVIDPA